MPVGVSGPRLADHDPTMPSIYAMSTTTDFSTVLVGAGFVPASDLADRLRMSRQHLGVTQQQMAALLDMKQGSYGHYESGRNKPRNLRQFCMAVHMVTGVDLGWLMTGVRPGDGGHDGDGLPLMDSNHQPCDSQTTSQHNSPLRMAA